MGIQATNGSTWYPLSLDTSNTIGDWIETGDNFGISIQLAGTWTGTISFEQTNDPVGDNAVYALLLMNAVTTTTTATSTTTNGLWQGPVYSKYFRVRFSTPTSGSPQAIIKLTQCSDQMAASFAVTVSGNPVLGTGSNVIGALAAQTGSTNAITISKVSGAASGFAKASAGRLFGWTFFNANAAIRYLQIYNKTSAGIPGTDTPYYTIGLGIGATDSVLHDIGITHGTGIAWAITTDAAGATAGASNDVVGTIFYA